MAAGVREIYRERVNKTLYLAGDGALRYGEIVAVIDASKGAGVNRVCIIRRNAPQRSPVEVIATARRRLVARCRRGWQERRW